MGIETVTSKLSQANTIKQNIRAAVIAAGVSMPEGTTFASYPDFIAKLKEIIDNQADDLHTRDTIQAAIREAILSEGITIPEDTPFEDYPQIVESIPGRLQTKTLTPTAAGLTATADEGFDGFSAVTLPAEPNLIPGNIGAGKSIFGVVGTAELPTYDVNGMIGGTTTDITSGTPSIRRQGFYNYTALQHLTLPSLTTIGESALEGCTGLLTVAAKVLKELSNRMCYGCTKLTAFETGAVTAIATYAFYNCQQLATLDLSKVTEIKDYGLYNCYKLALDGGVLTIPVIGVQGCYYLCNSISAGFKYKPSALAKLSNNAFQYARVTEVDGDFAALGSYAIANCGQLKRLNMKINGGIGDYGLASNQYVTEFKLKPGSDITALNQYAFYYMGWSRPNYATTDRLVIDLSECSFPSVGNYAFRYTRYTDIHLPETVTTIKPYAFQNSQYVNLYMHGLKPPTIESTNWWSSASNYKVFVPWNATDAYKKATNWTSIAANVVGYAPAGTFEAGADLPIYNGEGMAMTWYSDVGKTNVITTVPEGSPEIYCVSSDRMYWVVTADKDENTTLKLTDTEGVIYATFPAFIPTGRGFTLELVGKDGWSNYTAVGGKSVEMPYSVSVLTSDITITSKSWEGDIDPDFANCAWSNFKKAVKAGVAPVLFSVGATRTITLKDGQTFTLRLANNTADLYDYADGSGKTGFVLEFVELWKDYKYMNPSSTNAGGWDASYMRNTVMPLIWEQLPDDLKEVIATVNIKACKSGTDGTIVTSADTLFLPAESEIFDRQYYCRPEETAALKRWQWYAQHDTNNDRIKKKNGSAYYWWERSPYGGSAGDFCGVYYGGGCSYSGAYIGNGVAPGFCI